jgi:hypothetical protein
MALVRLPGPARASQIAYKCDEEMGTRSKIQTGTEEISEVERGGGVLARVEVREDLLNLFHATSGI